MAGIGGLAAMGAVADPREGQLSVALATGGTINYANRQLTTIHDPKVSFEEYLHYAKISRQEETRLYGKGSDFEQTSGSVTAFIKGKVLRRPVTGHSTQPRLSITEAAVTGKKETLDEKAAVDGDGSPGRERWEVSDAEWLNASRAARTATWGAIFYLIATDILGPFTTGWAFSQLGWGPGISLYTVFGVLSAYTGYQLWRMFIQMDSDRYPMRDFGDVAFRVYGQWARHICNILQSFQFFLNVGLIIISSGQSISQMSTGNLCFIICVLVCAIAGCVLGQVRTLARVGWLASLAVALNLFVIFSTMGVMSNSTPNYTAVAASFPDLLPDPSNPAPITYAAGSPSGLGLVNNVSGLMQAVFSYGGATLFINLLSEMRRPWDFWKGLLCAEIFIYTTYIVYGAFCYGMQGQYVYNPSYQGINPYGWQTVGNALELVASLIAACLYGNIGIKVLYNNVGMDLLNFPLLQSKKGKLIWVAMVPIYWLLAFIIAASIPQFAQFSAFVGAACILQFTYTFPPLLMLGFKTQRDAILPDETFDPATGQVQRKDYGIKRWIRGYKKELLWNTWDLIFFLGSAVTAVLGLYSSIYLMHKAYISNPNQAAFTCKSPTSG